MKYSATFITVGAGFAAALPNAAVPRQDLAAQHPWKAPGAGDVRAPCPGLNTLANHGFLPHDGKQISLDMVVKAFKDGFNMGSDIITSAGGSALSVCQQVTGAPCKAFNLDQLNTPHTFEHDASFTREDYNFGKGNNHDFSPAVFQTVLDVWKDTDVITYSYANAARLMRIQASKQNDAPGWFTESDGTQLTEVAFYMGTMGTPQDGNARKDWVTYWWTHERMPFELGWAPDQRPEHNQSTINTMINNIINAPAPPSVGTSSSSSSIASVASSTAATTDAGSSSATSDNSAVSSTTDGSDVSSTTDGSVVSTTDGSAVSSTEAPCTLPVGYGFTSDASTIEIVPITSTDGTSAPVATLPEGWTFTTAGTSSLVAFQPTPTSVAADTSSTDLASSAAATSSTDSSATRPTGFTSFAGNVSTTAPPSTVTFLTTSIGYAVTEITVTGGCTANATDCSSTESATATVITSTISSFTTLCPVTATIVPTGQDLITTTTPAADSSSSSTDSVSTDSASVSTDSASSSTDTPASSADVSSTTAPLVSFTYTQPTAPITFVSGNLVVPTTTATAAVTDNSTATAVTTDAATTSVAVATIPNPYFQSVAPEVFPSVPSEIISQYSATTGVFAAPSLAPQYTQTGSAAIAAATSGVVVPPAAPAPSASADVAATTTADTAAATTTTAAADFGYGAGAAQSSAAVIISSNSTSAPIQQSNDGSRQAVNGLLAALAVAVMVL